MMAKAKHHFKKKIVKKPATALQEFFIDTKKRKGIALSNEAKRTIAMMPKAQRSVWKRAFLSAELIALQAKTAKPKAKDVKEVEAVPAQ